MIHLLSVDWDYFFPDQLWYDWGHREDPIFMEFLWQIRATNRNFKTRAWAIDEYRVDRKRIHNFWKRVCPSFDVAVLYVTESHAGILDLIETFSFGKVSVWNFDAHHDLSYRNRTTPECDNWAWWSIKNKKIKEYHVVYPEWRLESPENDFPVNPTSVHYEVPSNLPTFDLVYICRSSAWTPSWDDHSWLRFVRHWQKRNGKIWESRRTIPFVDRRRYPNLQQARILRDEHISKYLDQIYKEKDDGGEKESDGQV